MATTMKTAAPKTGEIIRRASRILPRAAFVRFARDNCGTARVGAAVYDEAVDAVTNFVKEVTITVGYAKKRKSIVEADVAHALKLRYGLTPLGPEEATGKAAKAKIPKKKIPKKAMAKKRATPAKSPVAKKVKKVKKAPAIKKMKKAPAMKKVA